MINKYGFFLTIFTLVSFSSISQDMKSWSKEDVNKLATFCFCTEEWSSELRKTYNNLNKGIRPSVVRKNIPISTLKILYGMQITLINSGIKFYSENNVGFNKSQCKKELLGYINDGNYENGILRLLLLFHFADIAKSTFDEGNQDLTLNLIEIRESILDNSMSPSDLIKVISELPEEERAYFGF